MLTRLLDYLQPPVYENDLDQTLSAETTHRVVLAFVGISIVGILLTLFNQQAPEALVSCIALFLWITSLVLNKNGMTQLVNWFLVVFNLLFFVSITIISGGVSSYATFLNLIPIALAALLLPMNAAYITAITSIVLLSMIYTAEQQKVLTFTNITQGAFPSLLLYGFVAMILAIIVDRMARIFSTFKKRAGTSENQVLQQKLDLETQNQQMFRLTKELEALVSERTNELEKANESARVRAAQLKTITDIASTIAGVRSLDVLLGTVTGAISQELGYYHVGIFTISEDGTYAQLVAANSEGGKRMLERRHRLEVGKQGIVGTVASTKKPRIALDVGEDAVYFNNPDLPNTHSEIALPLVVSKNIIGILDVQSEESGAFSESDIDVLETLASQVAIAIENAKLYDQTTHALEEAERIHQSYIQQEWKQSTSTQSIRGYRYSGLSLKPIEKDEVYDQNPDVNFSIPVKLRGQTIGRLGLRKGNRNLSQDEISILEAAAERAALALENARLIEDTLKRASQERVIAEVTTKMGASMRFETILRTAAEELSKALNGSDVLVQIQPDALEKAERRQSL